MELRKPLFMHCRDAADKFAEILRSAGGYWGLGGCFGVVRGGWPLRAWGGGAGGCRGPEVGWKLGGLLCGGWGCVGLVACVAWLGAHQGVVCVCVRLWDGARVGFGGRGHS